MENKEKFYKYSAIVMAGLFIAISIIFIYNYVEDGFLTGRATTDAQLGNFTAGIQTFVSCTWSSEALNVSFGTGLDPGSNDFNATRNFNLTDPDNGTAYNVSIDTFTNVNANVTMRGSNLTSGANTLVVGNITWASSENNANHTEMNATDSIELTGVYDVSNFVADSVAPGNSAYFRFWLDVPSGQIAGTYTGNYTQLCQEE